MIETSMLRHVRTARSIEGSSQMVKTLKGPPSYRLYRSVTCIGVVTSRTGPWPRG